MHILLDLFLTFFKIGIVSFGGGYAMIPLISDEVVRYGMTNTEILNFIAVAESTPGPIAINMATFVGASQFGILGAACATLGVVLPSFIIILLIAALITGLLKYAGVKAFLGGIRPVVVGLIISTAIVMFLTVVLSIETVYSSVNFEWRALLIFGLVAGVHFGYKKWKGKVISPIILILISAVLGIILYGLL